MAMFDRTAGRSPVIDFHAHIIVEPLCTDRVLANAVVTGFGVRPWIAPPAGSLPDRFFVKSRSPQEHLQDMDAEGVDIHVISPGMVFTPISWAEEDESADMSRRMNDYVAAWCAAFPERFLPCCAIPLRHMDIALSELSRCAEMGVRVVILPSECQGAYLGDPHFDAMWEGIQALGLTAFIHPEGICDPWFQNYHLWNSIGQSIEEVRVMSSMIMEGVFEKYPRLKVVMAHGGGYMPHYMGRLDRNVLTTPGVGKNITKAPSAYLDNYHYDTCIYDRSAFDALIKRVGPERIVLGGDYPIGEKDRVGFVKGSAELSARDVDLILGGNAARLLGL